MRRYVRHLYFVNAVVTVNHVIKTVLPVHCHKRHTFIVIKQKSAVAVNEFFNGRRLSVLDYRSKAPRNVLRDRPIPVNNSFKANLSLNETSDNA